MRGTYRCKHCGEWFDDLSVHFPQCARKRAADDLARLRELEAEQPSPPVEAPKPAERLAQARAVLAEVEERKDVAPAKFDRAAYQREYMRRRRAKVAPK